MDLNSTVLLILCTLVSLIIHIHGDDEFDGQITMHLQHSFDSGSNLEYTDRGSISFRSMKASKFHNPIKIELTENDQLKLIELVRTDGFYRIRTPLKVNETIYYLTTFTKACALYESGLSDIITVHTGINGELLGISASTSQTLCHGNYVPESKLQYFNTIVEVRPTETGPTPDAGAFMQKMEKEKADRAKSDQGDNRSFFAKYWMYIVPAVVFMFISQIFSPDAQGGGSR